MKVLVTGASGRLGQFVVKDLVNAGHEVLLFSRRPPVEKLIHLPVIRGNITNFEDCVRALDGRGIEAIHHLAAQSWPTDHPMMRQEAEKAAIPFDATIHSNVLGVYYLLMAAVKAQVKIFVMTGSNCALGHGFRISGRPFPLRYLPIDEIHPSDVEDSYSLTKYMGEEMLATFSRAYGMRTYTIRAAEICDETRRRQILEEVRPLTEWSEWMYAWVGSEDVASAHRLLMECAYNIEPNGVYFCNSDDTTALEPSLEILNRWKPGQLRVLESFSGQASFFCNERLRRVTGWEPKTSWRNEKVKRSRM